MRSLLATLFVLLVAASPASGMPTDSTFSHAAVKIDPKIDTMAPDVGKWDGFVAPLTDTTTHKLNVFKAGAYIGMHFKLTGPINHGKVATDTGLSDLVDCASVASWPEHTVPPDSTVWNYEEMWTGTDYAYLYLVYPETVVPKCFTLSLTLLDGSTHSATFKIV